MIRYHGSPSLIYFQPKLTINNVTSDDRGRERGRKGGEEGGREGKKGGKKEEKSEQELFFHLEALKCLPERSSAVSQSLKVANPLAGGKWSLHCF